jgi:hypothetical protein
MPALLWLELAGPESGFGGVHRGLRFRRTKVHNEFFHQGKTTGAATDRRWSGSARIGCDRPWLDTDVEAEVESVVTRWRSTAASTRSGPGQPPRGYRHDQPRSYDDGRLSLCLGYIHPRNQGSRVALYFETASVRAEASDVGRDRPMWPGSARPSISPGRHVLPATTRTVAWAAKPESCKAGSGRGTLSKER